MILILLSDWLHEQQLLSPTRQRPAEQRKSQNAREMMAIIDRLLHHGEVFYLRGSSYRMRGKEPVALTSKEGGITT